MPHSSMERQHPAVTRRAALPQRSKSATLESMLTTTTTAASIPAQRMAVRKTKSGGLKPTTVNSSTTAIAIVSSMPIRRSEHYHGSDCFLDDDDENSTTNEIDTPLVPPPESSKSTSSNTESDDGVHSILGSSSSSAVLLSVEVPAMSSTGGFATATTTTTTTTTTKQSNTRSFHAAVALTTVALVLFVCFSVRIQIVEIKSKVSSADILSLSPFSSTQAQQSSSSLLSNYSSNPLRFCRQPSIKHNSNNNTDSTLNLFYQCQGNAYKRFGQQLFNFAIKEQQHHVDQNPLWGRRPFPVPANKTVLVLGNSHLRQISKTLMCQYADQIQYLKSITKNEEIFVVQFTNGGRWISITNTVLVYSKDWKTLLEEEYLKPLLLSINPAINNSTIGSSSGASISDLDAIVFGKFTRYQEAQNTNFEITMKRDQEQYYYEKTNVAAGATNNRPSSVSSPTIDFTTIPPPELVDVVRAVVASRQPRKRSFSQGRRHTPPPPSILSVPMFSISDLPRAKREREEYYQQLVSMKNHSSTTPSLKSSNESSRTRSIPKATGSTTGGEQHFPSPPTKILPRIQFVDTRQYVDALGLECGSDDKWTIGTCHEPDGSVVYRTTTPAGANATSLPKSLRLAPRNPSNMHRCAGAHGGHADLVAWSIVESLYDLMERET